ncbi:MAG: ABC transporter ATP-binding protein [Clostridia bacterium]|nr:ABC transporter ATP-binding protein [Clostridia bacterium]
MKNIKLAVKGLCKNFDGNRVLNDIDFQIESGEFVAVMGQSGCGKSTLLYSISGMDRASEGKIFFDNRELSELSDKEVQKLRLERMGFVFQKANFIKNLSIADNIVFPAFQLGKKTRKEIVNEAESLMKKMGIISVADHDIRKVSGGQLQRAAICRAMINDPDILFGDEPTGALNSSSTKEVMDILHQINSDGTTIMIVTHDAKVASRADRVIYLEDGKIKDTFSQDKSSENNLTMREKNLKEWLAKMGF